MDVNLESFLKSSRFNALNGIVDCLVEAHSVAEIVALVGNEISMDTGASYHEAQSASKLITA